MFLRVQIVPLGARKLLSKITRRVTVSVPHPQAPSTSPGSAPERCVEDGWPQAWCSGQEWRRLRRGASAGHGHMTAQQEFCFRALKETDRRSGGAVGTRALSERGTGPPGDKPPARQHPSVAPHGPTKLPPAATFSPIRFLFRCPNPASRPPPRCRWVHTRVAASVPAGSKGGAGTKACSSLCPPAGTLEAAGTSRCLLSLQQC